MTKRSLLNGMVLFALLCLLMPAVSSAGLSPELQQKLRDSTYVYISSTRKDGSLSKPAEIWFMYYEGAVYVGTPPTTWRVRRIKAGRPKAKIWVGSEKGPSFMANGSIVKDEKAQQALFEIYAKKYPDGWSRFADRFRNGFKDGSRVLVKYVPE